MYITEKDSESMLLEKDIEFFVKDPVKNRDVFTARGMFLHPSAELRQKYSSLETVPEESTRVFFYVEDYGRYAKNMMRDSAFVMQNSHRYLTILKDYSEVVFAVKTKMENLNKNIRLFHVLRKMKT